MVDWKTENEKFDALGSGEFLKDEDIIRLSEILEIQPFEDEFKDKNGQDVKKTRFRYVLKDRTVKVPWSVHKLILARQKEGFTTVKIRVYGQGLGKKYEVWGLEK